MHLPDYHTHTSRCGHAVGSATEYVVAARAAGLRAIGCADHLPLLPDHDPELAMPACDLDGYIAEVQNLKARYPGFVLLGIEADYRPQTIDAVRGLLGSRPFDYVIGSVHHLDDWGFDDPRQLGRWATVDIDQAWAEYYELVGEAAETGLFTIIGHLDLMKKFGHRPGKPLDADLDRLTRRLARAGVAVEINTAGLHKPAAEVYPAPDVLSKLRAAGVPITFGSDAHRPEHVGRDFTHAAGLARAAGYDSFAILVTDPTGGRARLEVVPLEEAALEAATFERPPLGKKPSAGPPADRTPSEEDAL